MLRASPWNDFALILFHYFPAFPRGSEWSYDTASGDFQQHRTFQEILQTISWITETSVQTFCFCFGSFSITPQQLLLSVLYLKGPERSALDENTAG